MKVKYRLNPLKMVCLPCILIISPNNIFHMIKKYISSCLLFLSFYLLIMRICITIEVIYLSFYNVMLGNDSIITSFKEERSEEHTSELQSRGHLVCRLLLEKIN